MNEHVEACSTPAAQFPTQPSDCTLEELASRRYFEVLDGLLDDAAAARHVRVLANALAWNFARIAARCGAAATGDMLRLVGEYMVKIETEDQAQRELEGERQDGRLPN
jgi:hypothetical protein